MESLSYHNFDAWVIQRLRAFLFYKGGKLFGSLAGFSTRPEEILEPRPFLQGEGKGIK